MVDVVKDPYIGAATSVLQSAAKQLSLVVGEVQGDRHVGREIGVIKRW